MENCGKKRLTGMIAFHTLPRTKNNFSSIHMIFVKAGGIAQENLIH